LAIDQTTKTDAGEALSGAYMDHPGIAAHVADGFRVWIL